MIFFKIRNVTRILLTLVGLLLALGSVFAQQEAPFGRLGGSLFSSTNDDFLSPDQAFKLQIFPQDGDSVLAQFNVAPGHYLYRDRITFSVEKPNSISVGNIELPPGEPKSDPVFGDTKVFHKPFSAVINLKPGAGLPSDVTLKASYQGCSEKGICYPPITKSFQVTLTPKSEPLSSPINPINKENSSPLVSDSNIAEVLAKSSLWASIGFFFLAGIGLAFTPCVLPMVPILSGIIAGHGKAVTRGRGFTLSVSYVLGMSITYALAGITAGLTGTLLAAALQNAWVLWGFAIIFLLLALSMFGLYDIRMPAIIQSQANSLSHRLSGGKVVAVFAMGALSALIVSPCVAAPLAGALLYISKTNDALLGGAALFTMALGMGTPLLAIGLSAGTLLPKVGAWMDGIKRFFGLLLLMVAIWVVSPVIPAVLQMLFWAALLIISASFLRAIDPLPPEAGGFWRLSKGLGVIALVAGIAILIGVLAGNRDLLQPLSGLRNSVATVDEGTDLGFERIRTVSELEERLQQTGRPIMLEFYADWCVSCKEMEQFTYRDARVAQRMEDLALLQVDVTQNTPDDKALLKRFGLFGPPGVIFFDSQGQEIRGLRVIGYQNAEGFLRTIDQVLTAIVSAGDPVIKNAFTIQNVDPQYQQRDTFPPT